MSNKKLNKLKKECANLRSQLNRKDRDIEYLEREMKCQYNLYMHRSACVAAQNKRLLEQLSNIAALSPMILDKETSEQLMPFSKAKLAFTFDAIKQQ